MEGKTRLTLRMGNEMENRGEMGTCKQREVVRTLL